MGSYNMDSHNVQRYVDDNGHARNEGDIQIKAKETYGVVESISEMMEGVAADVATRMTRPP